MNVRLPRIARRSRTGLMYFVYWAPFIALYQITNRWPVLTPRELPMTPLDRALPFVPDLLPVYVGYLPFYWWTVARSENDRQAHRIFWAAYVQLALSLPFFVLFPVRMPLETFYPEAPHGWADALWRWFDAPNNCFPSLHVSSCLLLTQFNWPRPHRWLTAAAAGAIIVSTVLVKQHYVVDVLGGVLVYLTARRIVAWLETAEHAVAASDGRVAHAPRPSPGG